MAVVGLFYFHMGWCRERRGDTVKLIRLVNYAQREPISYNRPPHGIDGKA